MRSHATLIIIGSITTYSCPALSVRRVGGLVMLGVSRCMLRREVTVAFPVGTAGAPEVPPRRGPARGRRGYRRRPAPPRPESASRERSEQRGDARGWIRNL